MRQLVSIRFFCSKRLSILRKITLPKAGSDKAPKISHERPIHPSLSPDSPYRCLVKSHRGALLRRQTDGRADGGI